ncbi:excisionase family DNA-binding protein [Nitratireductor aquimarinus]|uniref:excisionase family DNA-binding protein n=1 Tax=Nitratireductor aquimarinus TaxID=889300 RepID=UPI00398EFD0F
MTDDETPSVFTPRTLAERWECSERHVRNLIDKGELPVFRLGGKLLRIRRETVESYELGDRSPGLQE